MRCAWWEKRERNWKVDVVSGVVIAKCSGACNRFSLFAYILWYSVEYNRPMYKSRESWACVKPTAHFSSTTSNAAWTRYCNSSSLSKFEVAMNCGEFWNEQREHAVNGLLVNQRRRALTSFPIIAMHTAISLFVHSVEPIYPNVSNSVLLSGDSCKQSPIEYFSILTLTATTTMFHRTLTHEMEGAHKQMITSTLKMVIFG